MDTSPEDREALKAEIQDALVEMCRERGWSPTRLGAEAGVSANAAARWLNGESTPSGELLVLLARKFMVVRDRLLGSAAA